MTSVALVEDTADSASEPSFRVEGVLDFTTAAAALQELSEKLDQTERMSLDLSGVESANSAGLSVMIECLAQARRSNKTVIFHNIPESLRQVAHVCQVDELL